MFVIKKKISQVTKHPYNKFNTVKSSTVLHLTSKGNSSVLARGSITQVLTVLLQKHQYAKIYAIKSLLCYKSDVPNRAIIINIY